MYLFFKTYMHNCKHYLSTNCITLKRVAMQFTNLENEQTTGEVLTDTTSWGPEDDNEPVGDDWEDEDDEDLDDQLQDIDDLHEIQVDDDLGEPDPEDDDHFPDEYEEDDE